MKVRELIKKLQRFDPNQEVFGYDSCTPECISILNVTNGEFDGGIWVDTDCDGIYTGSETRCCQIGIDIHSI